MRRNRSTMKKERIIMLASSVFVLTALTMTGFYVKEKNNAEKDGYVVDMSAPKQGNGGETQKNADVQTQETNADNLENDLDYDPNFQEASSGSVSNTWEEGTEKKSEAANKERSEEAVVGDAAAEETEEAKEAEGAKETEGSKEAEESGESEGAESGEDVQETAAPALSFQERDALSWPVAGNVLINYSMDKTVYFPTLQQYKYNPAIIISAAEGENITASADGEVVSVFEDAQIGHAVTVDIGNGYELTYGQLDDIMVLKGDVISAGDVIGRVAAPTKYYSTEGPNVYFKLTKDGEAVNPLSRLE